MFSVKLSIMIIRRIVIFIIVTGAICKGKPTIQCGDTQFPCNDGSCVDMSNWCDTSDDCEDGSDEMYCFPRSPIRSNPNRCGEKFFVCNNGPCIPIVGRCDGYSSCEDNSDEEDCDTRMINETKIFDSETTAHIETSTFELELSTSGKINRQKSVEVSNHENMQSDFSSTEKTTQEGEGIQSETRVSLNVSQDDWNAKNKKYHDFGLELTSQNKSQINRQSSHNDDGREIKTPIAHNASQTEDALKDEAIQSNVHESSAHKKDDFEQKFTELNERQFRNERSRAHDWLSKVRDENYGWGDETARATVALYMSDDKFMKRKYGQPANEAMLMAKELNLRVFTALMRNQTKEISLEELALFINAISASCENPRNFHGTDLVNILRQRANLRSMRRRASSTTVVSPFVYLVLCLNNATDLKDIEKMKSYADITLNRKIDIDAVASLASTCISRNPISSGYPIGKQMAENLCYKVSRERLSDYSIYDLALVAQSLNEARIDLDRWNRSEAMRLLMKAQRADGSFGDILSTYYVVPLLSGRSLLSLNAHCQQSEDKGLVPIEVLKNGEDKSKSIHYALYFEDPPEMTQTFMFKVKKSSNILDIMRIAESLNPVYKFEYIMSRGKPYVYSVGGVVNDAEKGLYWTLHLASPGKPASSTVPFYDDIRNMVPDDGHVLLFWRKSAF